MAKGFTTTDPLAADTDGDGLSDGDEVNNIGSNPLDTDTDDGTVGDGVEVGQGTNPVNNPGDDILPDFDGDGKNNTIDTDDDNDGLTDEEEAALGTNPFNPDTDGDGLTDGDEVNNVGSNPLDTDTDDGTVNDGVEVDRGTSPLDPNDDVTEYVASVVGANPLVEGAGREAYRVQLDSGADEDITFTINTNDITADRANVVRDESIKYGWYGVRDADSVANV